MHDAKIQKKSKRIAIPILASVAFVGSLIFKDKIGFGDENDSSYTYYRTIGLIVVSSYWTLAKILNIPVIARLTNPIRIFLNDWIEGIVQPEKSAQQLLDYLTGKQINPNVMCSEKGSEERNLFPRGSGLDERCARQSCRCVLNDRDEFKPINSKRRLPGVKNLRAAFSHDSTSLFGLTGRLHSWSHRDIALTTDSPAMNTGNGTLAIRVKQYFLVRWWMVDVRFPKRTTERAKQKQVAFFKWHGDSYHSAAPAIPICKNHREKVLSLQNAKL